MELFFNSDWCRDGIIKWRSSLVFQREQNKVLPLDTNILQMFLEDTILSQEAVTLAFPTQRVYSYLQTLLFLEARHTGLGPWDSSHIM